MKGRRLEVEKMKKNYKLQNTRPLSKKKAGAETNTNYNVQNYKPNGSHASMQAFSQADIKGFGKSTPYYLLPTTYYLLLTSPWPPEAENEKAV